MAVKLPLCNKWQGHLICARRLALLQHILVDLPIKNKKILGLKNVAKASKIGV